MCGCSPSSIAYSVVTHHNSTFSTFQAIGHATPFNFVIVKPTVSLIRDGVTGQEEGQQYAALRKIAQA